MINNETDLRGKQENFTFSNSQVRENEAIRIDQHGAPDSNSLTEADREYFNIIKTEDGFSDFFKTKSNPDYILDKQVEGQVDKVLTSDNDLNDNDLNDNELISDNLPMFRYHLVSLDNSDRNKKPIIGLYLPDNI